MSRHRAAESVRILKIRTIVAGALTVFILLHANLAANLAAVAAHFLGGCAHSVERSRSRQDENHQHGVSLNIVAAGAFSWLGCWHKGPPSIRAKSLQEYSGKQSGRDLEVLTPRYFASALILFAGRYWQSASNKA